MNRNTIDEDSREYLVDEDEAIDHNKRNESDREIDYPTLDEEETNSINFTSSANKPPPNMRSAKRYEGSKFKHQPKIIVPSGASVSSLLSANEVLETELK